MSLAIVVKGPSGLVLAADSRISLTATPAKGTPFLVNFDNASKLLRFRAPHTFVGAVTWGQALVPGIERTAESLLPELQAALPADRVTVAEFAKSLSDFFLAQWKDPQAYKGDPMWFVVGGFDEGAPYGSMFQFKLPDAPAPTELYKDTFAAVWGGQNEIVHRIWLGHEAGLAARLQAALTLSDAQRVQIEEALKKEELAIHVGSLALQDCVNLAETLMRTTIAMQQLSLVWRGVGGPIDIVTITRTDGVKPVRLKEISVSG